ncbi:hypothetical protein O0J73_09495 [Stenotrophomonas sp. Sm6012]|uniref:hypothetical protein n=1 Tax=Stenotrophomonas sp. Sm6012 TaxID=3002745 RepID=UPI001F52BA14|nr:hypothetical protein [Stenotrophomonas sp. Sm6012]MDQ7280968.1 hypothetical protein [Stenotrophomonas sp. Sm6012]
MSTLNQALEDLTHNIDRARVLQSATAELSRQIHAERTVIEAALQSAQQSVDLEKDLEARGPAFRAIFEQSKAGLLCVLGEQPSSQEPRIERHLLPNFKHVGSHDHPDIQQAIDLKAAGILNDREAFLSMARAHLMSNPALLPAFESALQHLNGEHYWETLDPDRTLTQRA